MKDLLRIKNLFLTIFIWIGLWGIIDIIIIKNKWNHNQSLLFYILLIIIPLLFLKIINHDLDILEYP